MGRPSWKLPCGAALGLLVSAASAAAGDEPPSDLRNAVERFVGEPVRGTLTTRYRIRSTDDETDQDVYELLDLRVGDETKDRVSGTLLVRAFSDVDPRNSGRNGAAFNSIDDAFDGSVNALLYSAYATFRPETGPIEWVRAGRQYVLAAETFHLDGVAAATRPLDAATKLRLTGYAGIPVHFYEASASGDRVAGLRADAEPWKGARASLDYAHVRDRFSLLSSREANDLAAVSLGQAIGKHVDLRGEYEWLDGPREAALRATASWPEQDFLVQANYRRQLEDEHRLATEFDPYSNVIQELRRFHEAELSASKGFGEHFDVEAGAAARELLPGERTSPFNRDTRRVHVTPSLTDLPWKGTSVSVTGESLSGDGERIRTWGFEVSHRFSKDLKVSAGSDYSLYAYGPLATTESTHVRTAWIRARFRLSKDLSADAAYTWERDDAETFHVLTVGLVLEF